MRSCVGRLDTLPKIGVKMTRDYWPDARRIPADRLREVVAAIRAVRDRHGLSNAALCRQVRVLIDEHNQSPGREPVRVDTLYSSTDFSIAGDYELNAIIKGTRKYLVGYLAWLWQIEESAATSLYRQIGLPVQQQASTGARGSSNAQAAWSALIDAHGVFAGVEILPLEEQGFNLVGFNRKEPVSEHRIRLGEYFCFRFKCEEAANVIAFQRFRGSWYPMRLAREAWHENVSPGLTTIPRDDSSGDPLGLCEQFNAGTYGFAFTLLPDDRLLEFAQEFRDEQPLSSQLAPEFERFLAKHAGGSRSIRRINVEIYGESD